MEGLLDTPICLSIVVLFLYNSANLAMQKISIVTPSFNQGHFLEQTIDSVLSQQYPDLEYIIMDGGSTDNSVEIIRKYAKYLTYWESEKDRGQTHAINKGLARCTGPIFNWLNSDDFLEPGSLHEIARLFEDPNNHLVAGKVRFLGGSVDGVVDDNALLTAEGLMLWKPGVKFIQPGVWTRRDLLLACGGLDEQYQYCFDKDMLLRYMYSYPNVAYTDRILVNFRFHDDSKTVALRQRFMDETVRIRKAVAQNKAMPKLAQAAQRHLHQADWLNLLREAEALPHSRWSKVGFILQHAAKQPQTSTGYRMTLGMLKSILRGKPSNT